MMGVQLLDLMKHIFQDALCLNISDEPILNS